MEETFTNDNDIIRKRLNINNEMGRREIANHESYRFKNTSRNE